LRRLFAGRLKECIKGVRPAEKSAEIIDERQS